MVKGGNAWTYNEVDAQLRCALLYFDYISGMIS